MLDVPHVRLRLRDTATPSISNFYTYPSLVVRITFLRVHHMYIDDVFKKAYYLNVAST